MSYRLQLQFDAENANEANAIAMAVLHTIKQHGVNVSAGPLVPLTEADLQTVVYTDGGCDRNRDGIGAWAAVVQYPNGAVTELFDAYTGTTNNRMELMAVIKALEGLEMGPPVKIVTDSEYVAKGVTVWSRNWIRNGWKTANGSPVLNQDLWEELLQLFQLHSCTFEVVKGHTGVEGNERADSLCTAAMINAHKAMLAGEDVQVDDGCQQVAA